MNRPRSPWFPRIGIALLTAVLTTPLAGATGGAVLWGVVRMEQPEASSLALLAFMFYGMFFGGVTAAPVTLLVLPIATVLLHARRRLSRWLLPLLGMLAGAVVSLQTLSAPPGSGLAPSLRDADIPLLLACVGGGLLAGLMMAWLPPLFSPRAFPTVPPLPRPGA